jgi:hypothetical protein
MYRKILFGLSVLALAATTALAAPATRWFHIHVVRRAMAARR